MKKPIYDPDIIYTLNKIYFNLYRLNRNFDVLIDLTCREGSRMKLAGSVSPIIQRFKPQNNSSKQTKKKGKYAIESQISKLV